MGLIQKCSSWVPKFGFLELLGAVLSTGWFQTSAAAVNIKHRPVSQ